MTKRLYSEQLYVSEENLSILSSQIQEYHSEQYQKQIDCLALEVLLTEYHRSEEE